MSENIDYGYVIPAANDESLSQWMPVVTAFLRRIASHGHDGDDSTLLQSSVLQKYTVDLTSNKIGVSGLTYSENDTIIDLGVASVTAGMYVAGDDLNFNNYVTGVTGNYVTLFSGVTGDATGDGILEFSSWKRSNTSVYEKTITLPTGYPSRTSMFNFYVINEDEYQYNQIFPTLVFDELNLITIKMNKNSYDMTMVVM